MSATWGRWHPHPILRGRHLQGLLHNGYGCHPTPSSLTGTSSRAMFLAPGRQFRYCIHSPSNPFHYSEMNNDEYRIIQEPINEASCGGQKGRCPEAEQGKPNKQILKPNKNWSLRLQWRCMSKFRWPPTGLMPGLG